MKARYVQKGESIDYTPSSAVAAGDVIVIGDIVAIAKLDIAAGTLGSLAVVGAFDVVKATTEGSALAAGSKIYWDAANQVATATATGNIYMGESIVAAVDADTTVRVRLNGAATPTMLPAAEDAVADADAITAVSPTWGDTTAVNQAAALQTFSDAVVADVTELQTQLNATLAALRAYGVIDA